MSRWKKRLRDDVEAAAIEQGERLAMPERKPSTCQDCGVLFHAKPESWFSGDIPIFRWVEHEEPQSLVKEPARMTLCTRCRKVRDEEYDVLHWAEENMSKVRVIKYEHELKVAQEAERAKHGGIVMTGGHTHE